MTLHADRAAFQEEVHVPGRLGVECRHGRLGHRLRSSPLLILLLAAACSATPATSPSGTGAPTPSTSDTTTTPSPPVSIVPTPTPESTPTQTPSPTQTQTQTPSPTATPGSVLHTVARGETPSIIAARFDTTWQSLVFWNRERYPGLDPDDARYDPNRIEVGWQLIVWPCVIVPYDAPMPMPSASPRPTSPSSAGTPSTLVSHGSRSSGSVALTFDMGGRTDPAVAIMTWLRDHGVPATVFMTGSSVDTTNATRQVIGIINANPAQFDLGNHSYSHPDITTMSASQVAAELRRAEQAIAYATQPSRPIFRPPYGAWDAEMLASVGAAGYRWSVMWDVDTIDWKPITDGGPTAAQIVSGVVGRAQGGSIVLMHLGGYETLDALPDIVSGLRARGLTLVTLEEMLGG